jgi:hypothetical protein
MPVTPSLAFFSRAFVRSSTNFSSVNFLTAELT